MTSPLVLAVPSKGRRQQNAEAFFARAGLDLVKPRGARDYRGKQENDIVETRFDVRRTGNTYEPVVVSQR